MYWTVRLKKCRCRSLHRTPDSAKLTKGTVSNDFLPYSARFTITKGLILLIKNLNDCFNSETVFKQIIVFIAWNRILVVRNFRKVLLVFTHFAIQTQYSRKTTRFTSSIEIPIENFLSSFEFQFSKWLILTRISKSWLSKCSKSAHHEQKSQKLFSQFSRTPWLTC